MERPAVGFGVDLHLADIILVSIKPRDLPLNDKDSKSDHAKWQSHHLQASGEEAQHQQKRPGTVVPDQGGSRGWDEEARAEEAPLTQYLTHMTALGGGPQPIMQYLHHE